MRRLRAGCAVAVLGALLPAAPAAGEESEGIATANLFLNHGTIVKVRPPSLKHIACFWKMKLYCLPHAKKFLKRNKTLLWHGRLPLKKFQRNFVISKTPIFRHAAKMWRLSGGKFYCIYWESMLLKS